MELFNYKNNYYYLMNKDVRLCRFRLEVDLFEENIKLMEVYTTNTFFLGIVNKLEQWIASRKPPKNRKFVEQLLRAAGCNNTLEYLEVSKALSLNDTLWVKRVENNSIWDSVSLYSNEFNDLLANTAFTGSFTYEMGSTSPELSTDGGFPKCWKRNSFGEIEMIKSGSDKLGIEPISEFIASRVSSALCRNSVDYEIVYFKDKLSTRCKLFTSEEKGFVPIGRVLGGTVKVKDIFSFFESIGSLEEFKEMLVLDAVVYNVDRHLGNYGVMINNDSGAITGMAPVFDNNLSLLPNFSDDQLRNYKHCMFGLKPLIGFDFIEIAKYCLTNSIRNKLESLEGISLAGLEGVSEERISLLSEMVNYNVKRILE